MRCLNQRILIFSISLICFFIAQTAKAALVDDLKDGQHVLLMRHADAPGYGDPAGYVIGQCPTQRNLGDYGKKQAKAIGSWLRGQGINKAQIFSSPWCRCSDTAQLLDLGSVKIETPLGSFFDDMSLGKKQTKELEQLIKSELDNNLNCPLFYLLITSIFELLWEKMSAKAIWFWLR